MTRLSADERRVLVARLLDQRRTAGLTSEAIELSVRHRAVAAAARSDSVSVTARRCGDSFGSRARGVAGHRRFNEFLSRL